MIPK